MREDTERSLVAEYAAWVEGEGLPNMSADELIHEDLTIAQRIWLSDFIQRWDVVVG